MSRNVAKIFENKEQSEGAGARVRRSIGGREIKNFDPFLLLDEFMAKGPAGFPDHPHRGFETVTYMLNGSFEHQDFKGHKGIINSGDLQWMTAGRGIVHSEMPIGDQLNHGLQLWVNLSKENKMIEPQYQELKKQDIPEVSSNGVTVRVIAGEAMNVKSPVYTRTPTMYLDFKLEPNASYTQSTPSDWNAFIFVLEGEGTFGNLNNEIKGVAHHTLILSHGDSIKFSNKTNKLLHFVLIAGKPLNEPIFREGPFVMNTKEELEKANYDFENHLNGFENGAFWKSDTKSN